MDHKELLDVLELFDHCGRRQISTADVHLALQCLGVNEATLTPDVLATMCAAMDPGKTGFVPFDVFETVVLRSTTAPWSLEEQWSMFRIFDRYRRGTVNAEDVVAVSREDCDHLLSVAECQFIVDHIGHASLVLMADGGGNYSASPPASPRARSRFRPGDAVPTPTIFTPVEGPSCISFDEWKRAISSVVHLS